MGCKNISCFTLVLRQLSRERHGIDGEKMNTHTEIQKSLISCIFSQKEKTQQAQVNKINKTQLLV